MIKLGRYSLCTPHLRGGSSGERVDVHWDAMSEFCNLEREIERDFLFFESASGRFEPATPA